MMQIMSVTMWAIVILTMPKKQIIKYKCIICGYDHEWDDTWSDEKKAEVKAEVDAHHNGHIIPTSSGN